MPFRAGLPDECPYCGKPIYFGLWTHMERCGREKQRSEDARRVAENGRRFVEEILIKKVRVGTKN